MYVTALIKGIDEGVTHKIKGITRYQQNLQRKLALTSLSKK